MNINICNSEALAETTDVVIILGSTDTCINNVLVLHCSVVGRKKRVKENTKMLGRGQEVQPLCPLHPLSRCPYTFRLKLSIKDNTLCYIYALLGTSIKLYQCFGMTKVNKGPKDQRVGSKPCISCSKSLVDCWSRIYKFLVESHSTSPAREQHETGSGASLMALCLSLPLSSHQHTERGCRVHSSQPASCADSKAGLLCVKVVKGKIREQQKKKDMR